MINVSTLILILSISHFRWLCSSLYILWSLYLSAMLVTSTLAINCSLKNVLNKAIGIINFAKTFLNFIEDTMN